MFRALLSDKQFMFGVSLGVVCTLIHAVWKYSKSGQSIAGDSAPPPKKKKKNAQHKMVLVVRKDTKLVKREMIVHCATAATEAFKKSLTVNPNLVKQWQRWGQMKIAVKVNNESELLAVKAEADNNNLVNYLVRCSDKSRRNPLVLAIGPDDADDINSVTGHLKLL